MKPCKHLSYDAALYGEAADLVTVDVAGVLVRYWRRKQSQLPYTGAPTNVQFCGAGRGRITGPRTIARRESGCERRRNERWNW